ncbi:hypothetical protein LRR80_04833 [Streptomyces sp. RO-S4]|uniref:hypothetical protein n=1 Tax=unclassified Streptomyces TaxID=2593676 RepID=UPI00208E55E8|nr:MULTISPECIES: hypothetical protein [unclassified Streptomyces]MCO4698745.1 hypothetical protein [Streptomyces sp. RO-S4]MDU0301519.1 hypothetical protein [Streptomyces sp. PAL114]
MKEARAACDKGFTVTMSYQGVSHTLDTQVVRAGDVMGVYSSANGLAIANANARTNDADLPSAVVKAQNAKLE